MKQEESTDIDCSATNALHATTEGDGKSTANIQRCNIEILFSATWKEPNIVDYNFSYRAKNSKKYSFRIVTILWQKYRHS